MKKIKILHLYVEESDYEGVTYEQVSDEEKNLFGVCNLNECPEDAIIGRDLFDAYDFLKAVRYGIKLAKQGYDEVELVEE
jgi:hypothetical protein